MPPLMKLKDYELSAHNETTTFQARDNCPVELATISHLSAGWTESIEREFTELSVEVRTCDIRARPQISRQRLIQVKAPGKA